MTAVLSIVRRELYAYFVSPIAYTIITIFLLLSASGFLRGMQLFLATPAATIEENGITLQVGVIGHIVRWVMIGMILCLPALSMRLFTEERSRSTAELLLTSPITTPQLVLGKYLGSVAVLAVMLALTLPLPLILEWLAEPYWPAVAVTYGGMLLYGSVLLAIGLFASSLTENQIVALLLTYAMFLPFWLVEFLVGFMGGAMDDILAGLTLNFALRFMGSGLIDTHYVVLCVVLITGFLFLCVQVLDSNRWR